MDLAPTPDSNGAGEADEVVRLASLSPELIEAILSSLPVPDLGRALQTCTTLRAAGRAESPLWSAMAARTLGIHVPSGVQARLHLQTAWGSEPRRLAFHGVLTDGGIDTPHGDVDVTQADLNDRLFPCWVDAMFNPVPWLVYCSDAGVDTVTCVGQLAGLHDLHTEDQERARRAYMLDRLRVVADTVWGVPVEGFGGLASQAPVILDDAFLAATEMHFDLLLHGLRSTIEQGQHVLKIRRIRAQIEADRVTRRRPRGEAAGVVRETVGDRSCLVDARVSAALLPRETVAVVKRLAFRKAMMCSCPASHLAVFTAVDEVGARAVLEGDGALGRITSHVVSGTEWPGWFMEEDIGRVVRRTDHGPGLFTEFAPPDAPTGAPALVGTLAFRMQLEPVADVSAVPLITFDLAHWRPARYLVVKLLAAENLMAACNDDHEEMNVDMDFVGADGCLLEVRGEGPELLAL
mmetsp:Transcript_21367/g.71880  ORF Transcript_21367/g.71880 Transcript_21367/m.71880 type:complete len:463 (-) Transcript_21367:490-1878(-)